MEYQCKTHIRHRVTNEGPGFRYWSAICGRLGYNDATAIDSSDSFLEYSDDMCKDCERHYRSIPACAGEPKTETDKPTRIRCWICGRFVKTATVRCALLFQVDAGVWEHA